MRKRNITAVIVFGFAVSGAAADDVFFHSVQPTPPGLGEGFEAIFKHGDKESGLALYYNCQALVNQTNVQIYGAFMRNFKDNSNELLSTMPNAVRDAQEACKAKGVSPATTPSSQNFEPRMGNFYVTSTRMPGASF